MIVPTSRYGDMEMDEQRVLTFEQGLLGFPEYRDYVLIEPEEDGYFFQLQSLDAPDLAFVVTDPSLFIPDYRVPVGREQMSRMGIRDVSEAQVLVIVNKRGDQITANLQGPLVIHNTRRVGVQLVLSDRRFTTCYPLLDIHNEHAEAVSA